MTYKPPEKELTPDEAVALAKKELSPYWFNSAPQIASVPSGGRAIIFPLNKNFSKYPWLIFLADPTQLSTGSVSEFLREWSNRYAVHHLSVLMVLYPVYSFLLDRREMIQESLEKNQITFPIVLDHSGGLSTALEASEFPKIMLLHQNKQYFEYEGQGLFSKIELDIQTFLRSSDPGLPLLPIYRPKLEQLEDHMRIEFGFRPRLGEPAQFPESPAQEPVDGVRKTQFVGFRPDQLELGQVIISGLWSQDAERMMTSDSSAYLEFLVSGSTVSLIAQAQEGSKEVSRILVELDRVPVTEIHAGDHLTLDEVGQSFVSFKKAKSYLILKHLPEGQHLVTLKFINAEFAPVLLYGVRMAVTK